MSHGRWPPPSLLPPRLRLRLLLPLLPLLFLLPLLLSHLLLAASTLDCPRPRTMAPNPKRPSNTAHIIRQHQQHEHHALLRLTTLPCLIHNAETAMRGPTLPSSGGRQHPHGHGK